MLLFFFCRARNSVSTGRLVLIVLSHNAGAYCSRVCAYGKGSLNSQPLPFRTPSAITVSCNIYFDTWLLKLHPVNPKPVLLYFVFRTALAGIVTLLHACLDMKSIILGKYHYVLYFLVLAMQVSAMLYFLFCGFL